MRSVRVLHLDRSISTITKTGATNDHQRLRTRWGMAVRVEAYLEIDFKTGTDVGDGSELDFSLKMESKEVRECSGVKLQINASVLTSSLADRDHNFQGLPHEEARHLSCFTVSSSGLTKNWLSRDEQDATEERMPNPGSFVLYHPEGAYLDYSLIFFHQQLVVQNNLLTVGIGLDASCLTFGHLNAHKEELVSGGMWHGRGVYIGSEVKMKKMFLSS